jgi:hypothetical protein
MRRNWLRYVCVGAGGLLMVLAVGYFFQIPLATQSWPWPDGRLSYIFIASVLAAVAVAAIWIGFAQEWGALAAGALNVFVTSSGMALFFLNLQGREGRASLLPYLLLFALVAACSMVVFLWSRRIPIRDTRPTPRPVRWSFVVFIVLLFVAGGALIARVPNVFPWPLNPDSSVMFGCIFLGDACYFLYSLLIPRWHNAKAQLLSFLAYDLMLILPFLQHFSAVQPPHRLSLVIYTAVLVYSGVLAFYYLFRYRGEQVKVALQHG